MFITYHFGFTTSKMSWAKELLGAKLLVKVDDKVDSGLRYIYLVDSVLDAALRFCAAVTSARVNFEFVGDCVIAACREAHRGGRCGQEVHCAVLQRVRE